MINPSSTMRQNNQFSHREDNIDDITNINANHKRIKKTKNHKHIINNNKNNNKKVIRSSSPNYHALQTLSSNKQCSHRLQNLNNAIQRDETTKQHRKLQNISKRTKFQDTEWYGDKLVKHNNWETGEHTDTIRVCLININGIAQDLNWIEWDTTLRSMYSLQVDILGITEPNINFKNRHVQSTIKDIGKAFERNIQISTSCSNQLKHVKKRKEVQ